MGYSGRYIPIACLGVVLPYALKLGGQSGKHQGGKYGIRPERFSDRSGCRPCAGRGRCNHPRRLPQVHREALDDCRARRVFHLGLHPCVLTDRATYARTGNRALGAKAQARTLVLCGCV